MPAALRFTYELLRPFLAPKTAAKILLLCGPAAPSSPCPVALGELVSLDALREDERERHEALAKWEPPAST